jgi:hypothetical protein
VLELTRSLDLELLHVKMVEEIDMKNDMQQEEAFLVDLNCE